MENLVWLGVAICAAWCMYWVVSLHDSFNRLLDLTDSQSEREALFLARHVNVPLPGGARPHGDASRITRTSEPSPLVAGGPLVTSPPPFPPPAEPAFMCYGQFDYARNASGRLDVSMLCPSDEHALYDVFDTSNVVSLDAWVAAHE